MGIKDVAYFGFCYEVDIGTHPLLRWGRMSGREICRKKSIVLFWLSRRGLLDISVDKQRGWCPSVQGMEI